MFQDPSANPPNPAGSPGPPGGQHRRGLRGGPKVQQPWLGSDPAACAGFMPESCAGFTGSRGRWSERHAADMQRMHTWERTEPGRNTFTARACLGRKVAGQQIAARRRRVGWGARRGSAFTSGELGPFRTASLRTRLRSFTAPGSPASYAACATGFAWMCSWHGAQTTSARRPAPGARAGRAGPGQRRLPGPGPPGPRAPAPGAPVRLRGGHWSSPPPRSTLELIPCRHVRPSAAYFPAGHRLLDSLARSLAGPRPAPSRTAGHQRTARQDNDMPQFMDFHENLKLPAEAIA